MFIIYLYRILDNILIQFLPNWWNCRGDKGLNQKNNGSFQSDIISKYNPWYFVKYRYDYDYTSEDDTHSTVDTSR